MVSALSTQDILRILPHRYPFLFVDAVLEYVAGTRILATKNVSFDEPFFIGHFPERPAMPGLLIVEAMAQAGGLLLLAPLVDGARTLVYFSSVNNVRWHAVVRPGDQLRLDVVVTRRRGSIHQVHARALVGDTLVCEGDLAAVLVPG